MRVGIGSYTFPWAVGVPGHVPPEPLTACGLLDRAAELGVSVVQVCDNLPLHALAEADLQVFGQRALELGVTVEVGTRGIAPPHLRAYLGLATRLQSPLVRTLTDVGDCRPSPEEVVRDLRAVIGEFEAAGVCLALENHDRFRAETLRGIIEAVGNANLGICLDTANSFGALEGPEAVVRTLAPHTVSLHVKDFAICRRSHNLGFTIEGRPAGRGQLDLPWVLREVSAARPEANAILELWTPPEADLAATIAKEVRWAAESVACLQSILSSGGP
jgi:sugar phosphate isomerase/epimerase